MRLSEILFHFTLIEVLIAAPILGRPGLIDGGVLGAILLEPRLWRTVGRILGCIVRGANLAGVMQIPTQ